MNRNYAYKETDVIEEKEFHVSFNAIFDGYVNVLAKNKKDAYIKVRSALEPKIDGVFKDNDTLFLDEKYEIKATKETRYD